MHLAVVVISQYIHLLTSSLSPMDTHHLPSPFFFPAIKVCLTQHNSLAQSPWGDLEQRGRQTLRRWLTWYSHLLSDGRRESRARDESFLLSGWVMLSMRSTHISITLPSNWSIWQWGRIGQKDGGEGGEIVSHEENGTKVNGWLKEALAGHF